MKRVRLGGNLYHPVIPAGAVRIDRPTKWGNPYPVRTYGLDGSLRLFRGWLHGDLVAVEEARHIGCRLTTYGPALIQIARQELTGRDLACWCPPEARCHGDIWLAALRGEQL